ncbi:superoxide dismutase [Marinoscillum sp. 108]|uniref:superoxide dismutase n=1 Tax=Marinoscillum sp. 108 TaxID=2653151 RepID=UPI0012F23F71|nr:superoxide dismutase [Marinoscillum sp. 108]VXD10994.1 superoxide dismutase, Mn [Marinoscillum sp. 108]
MSFELPALPYAYNALDAHIDTATMEIHHTKHHQAYVNKLNDAIKGTEAEGKSLEEIIKNISKFGAGVRNNGGGHYNHSLFWTILSPSPAKAPEGALKAAIDKKWGSLADFKTQFEQAAATRFGSGWAWLYVTADGEVAIASTPNQDNPLMDVNPENGTPILGLDVWEHAYYLKYQNKRPDYITAFWNVLDWKAVEANYAKVVG